MLHYLETIEGSDGITNSFMTFDVALVYVK